MDTLRRAPEHDEQRKGPHVAVLVGGMITTFHPDEAGVVIGRAHSADVVLDDPNVSKAHVRIAQREGRVIFEDLGSTNGTWLNDARVARGVLAVGDALVIGSARIEYRQGPSRAPGLLSVAGFHQRFVAERERALDDGRPLALITVETGKLDAEAVARLLALLDAADRATLLREGLLAILATAPTEGQLRTLVDALRSVDEGLQVGLALYPGAGRDLEALIQSALGRGLATAPPSSEVLVGRATQELWTLVARAAPSSVPVLVLGETGTGKEVVARALHERSPRASRPFRVVNCGAIPATLLESTLFGAERGAFTGADRTLKGLFEQAHGGTLFLDELGEMPLAAQAALLRVLETGRVTRVGGDREFEVDVRIVSATHRDLEARCAEGGFRWDLYYRIHGLSLTLPPLRDRIDEIVPLAKRFLLAGGSSAQLGDEALRVLTQYPWPGNIRELRNAMQRAALVSTGPIIRATDLPERLRKHLRSGSTERTTVADEEGSGLRDQLRQVEIELITRALERTGWNTSLAAHALNLPVRTLTHKMSQLGIRRG